MRSKHIMKITKIDHFVLTVRDLKVTCDFYERILKMEVITFGNARKALKFGCQKINLHQFGREYEPKALQAIPGSADLCFITETPLDQVINQLQQAGVKILEGPLLRTGAEGEILSVYIRDPDGNLIELSNYQSS